MSVIVRCEGRAFPVLYAGGRNSLTDPGLFEQGKIAGSETISGRKQEILCFREAFNELRSAREVNPHRPVVRAGHASSYLSSDGDPGAGPNAHDHLRSPWRQRSTGKSI